MDGGLAALLGTRTAAGWEALYLATWLVSSLAATWHLLLNRRSPESAILWLLVVNGIPVLGPLFYTGFGIHRIGRRATIKQIHNRAVRTDIDALMTHEEPWSELPREIGALPPYLEGFATTVANLSRYRATEGNEITALRGGEETFPRMLEAIDGAQSSVLVETYIFEADDVGLSFLRALRRAAQRGVGCHLLYDSVGSVRVDLVALGAAEADGVKVSAFTSRNWLRGRFQVNLRNHRKILVVDGAVGFTGGMNVSAEHQGSGGAPAEVSDWHFAVRGPVVQQLTAAFAEDWFYATGERLVDRVYYPRCPAAGTTICRVVPSGPDGDYEVFYRVLVAALHAARDTLRIATPYFIPDAAVQTALELAALRGVRVQLVLPEKCDHRIVDQAMRSYYDRLLDAGCELWVRPPPFLHAKLLVVDGLWAMVGSANLDTRSFRLNYELNLALVGADAVGKVAGAFEEERRACRKLDAAEWRRRGPLQRAWSSFCALWSPLL